MTPEEIERVEKELGKFWGEFNSNVTFNRELGKIMDEDKEHNEAQHQLEVRQKRFDELQKRDGLPDEQGLTHCRKCHGADLTLEEYQNPYFPCGHTAGCPEC